MTLRASVRAPFVCASIVLAACGGSSGSPARESPSAATSQIGAAPTTAAAATPSITYGRHYPNGAAAFEYITGPEGMWKQMVALEYVWNYYEHCAAAGKPHDRETLIRSADGTRLFTSPDADCNLLLDRNQDGQLDGDGGSAFHLAAD